MKANVRFQMLRKKRSMIVSDMRVSMVDTVQKISLEMLILAILVTLAIFLAVSSVAVAASAVLVAEDVAGRDLQEARTLGMTLV